MHVIEASDELGIRLRDDLQTTQVTRDKLASRPLQR